MGLWWGIQDGGRTEPRKLLTPWQPREREATRHGHSQGHAPGTKLLSSWPPPLKDSSSFSIKARTIQCPVLNAFLTCLAVGNPQGSKQCQLPVFPCIWTTMAHMCACGSPHPGKGMWEDVVRPTLLASNTNEPQLAQVTGHMSWADLETSNQQHGPWEGRWRLREKRFLVSTDIRPRDNQAGKDSLSPQGRSSDSWEEKLPPVSSHQ